MTGTFEQIFKKGMSYFDAFDYPEARRHFAMILQNATNSAYTEDATYFHAVTFWREGDLHSTIREFSKLLDKYARGRWAAGAHYHIGLAYKDLGDIEKARREFAVVLENFSSDGSVSALAKDELSKLPRHQP